MTLMWHCQLRDTEEGADLPLLILDVEKQHDAAYHYCEHFGIDQQDVNMSKSSWHRYYWLQCEDLSSEAYDIQIF